MSKLLKLLRSPFVWVILPVFLVIAVDAIFTLIGQPAAYWQDFSKVLEGSFVGALFLRLHPLAFVGALALEALGILILIRFLPTYLDRVVGIAFFVGHAWGSATWIPHLIRRYSPWPFDPWVITIIYFITLALFASFFIGLWWRSKKRELKKALS